MYLLDINIQLLSETLRLCLLQGLLFSYSVTAQSTGHAGEGQCAVNKSLKLRVTERASDESYVGIRSLNILTEVRLLHWLLLLSPPARFHQW